MPAQALAALATLLAAVPHGNRFELQLDRGAAEIVWLSPSSFHFRRTLQGPLPLWRDAAAKPFDLELDDGATEVRFRTKFLEVSIRKSGVLVSARKRDGVPLTADLTEPHEIESGVEWDRQAAAGARYYGLGARPEVDFDLRGKRWPTEVPLLLSSAGYGESHLARGRYQFDLTSPGRYRIQAPAIDYRFHYGPGVKHILENEHAQSGTPPNWKVDTAAPPSFATLRDALLRIVNGAMSGMLEPEFDLARYAATPAEVQQRARQLGSLVREVVPGAVGLSSFRTQLDSYLRTYAVDRDSRGFPLWHPLPFQFPDDPECARHADEFMFGDEMLIAPIYEPGNRRSVYLPQGVWTNLATNEVFPGRRTITVDTAALPVFARNGMIVPLDSPAGIALHYFPNLGAEFFLLEPDLTAWTQVHASPALDIIRLQIESKKARDYQWVVHHVAKPGELEFEGKKLTEVTTASALVNDTWFYDQPARNLQVRVAVGEGEDRIVNIVF